MEWGQKSKKAFIQALNIEFLTTTGNCTNFQYKKSEIHMLFTSKQKEECKKYLELVIQKYNNALISQGKTLFDFNDFPFCIASGSFNVQSNGRVEFKISLSDKILHNLYHMFMNQIFSLKINNMPNCLGLTRDNREKQGYIAGWLFSSEDNHSDLIKKEMIIKLLDKYTFKKSEGNALIKGDKTSYYYIYLLKEGAENAIQKAVQDFPKELLSRYPKSLLMLFNIFYHHLCSKGLQKKEISSECKRLIKEVLGCNVHTAKADGNTVYFDYLGESFDKIRDQKFIQEIHNLYKDKKSGKVFYNFMNFKQVGQNNIRVSFNFDLNNISVIMNKIPCDMDNAEKARELANKQLQGTAVPSSSKQDFLQIPESLPKNSTSLKRDSSVKSDRSNDSALGASASSTGCSDTELRRNSNSKSFDSGNHSRPSSSDMAGSKNSEQESSKVRSSKDVRFYRSGSLPLCKDEKVLDAVKVEKVVSFDSLRSELLTK